MVGSLLSQFDRDLQRIFTNNLFSSMRIGQIEDEEYRIRVPVYILCIRHYRTMIRVFHFTYPICIDFLDHSACICDRQATRRGGRRGYILFVKRRGPCPALAIQGVRSHFVRQLTLVQDIGHEWVRRSLRLFLCFFSRPQQLHEDRRHHRFFVVRQLGPANNPLPRFRFHRLRGRSQGISSPLECVELDLYILVGG